MQEKLADCDKIKPVQIETGLDGAKGFPPWFVST